MIRCVTRWSQLTKLTPIGEPAQSDFHTMILLVLCKYCMMARTAVDNFHHVLTTLINVKAGVAQQRMQVVSEKTCCSCVTKVINLPESVQHVLIKHAKAASRHNALFAR